MVEESNKLFNAITFLKDNLKADTIPHTDRTLFDHLCNVEKILRICRCEEYVCLAGLYHSVYGTSAFKNKLISDRKNIKEVIGNDAEKLVWIFCSIKRPVCWNHGTKLRLLDNKRVLNVSEKTLHDLHMIESANLIDQRNPPIFPFFIPRKKIDF